MLKSSRSESIGRKNEPVNIESIEENEGQEDTADRVDIEEPDVIKDTEGIVNPERDIKKDTVVNQEEDINARNAIVKSVLIENQEDIKRKDAIPPEEDIKRKDAIPPEKDIDLKKDIEKLEVSVESEDILKSGGAHIEREKTVEIRLPDENVRFDCVESDWLRNDKLLRVRQSKLL